MWQAAHAAYELPSLPSQWHWVSVREFGMFSRARRCLHSGGLLHAPVCGRIVSAACSWHLFSRWTYALRLHLFGLLAVYIPREREREILYGSFPKCIAMSSDIDE